MKDITVYSTTLLLLSFSLPAWPASHTLCRSAQTSVIDSETHCVDNGGIDIGDAGEGGLKVACMQNKRVQNTCGPDGRLTRLHAYTLWLSKLKAYETECASQGGTFLFEDPSFVEPQDESFCMQAQPEIGSNMFEEPLCNYRSVCPAVVVACNYDCNAKPALYETNPIGETSGVPSAASLISR